MTVKDVIGGFREGTEKNAERDAYANELFQEAVRIGMELNTSVLYGFWKKYHNRKRCLYQFRMPLSGSGRD